MSEVHQMKTELIWRSHQSHIMLRIEPFSVNLSMAIEYSAINAIRVLLFAKPMKLILNLSFKLTTKFYLKITNLTN